MESIVNKLTGKVMRCPLTDSPLIPSDISIEVYNEFGDDTITVDLCHSPHKSVPVGFFWDIKRGDFYIHVVTQTSGIKTNSKLWDAILDVEQGERQFLRKLSNKMFKGKSTAALGTIARQQDTCVRKLGLCKERVFPFIFGYQLYIDYHYDADYDGNVTGRSYTLEYNYTDEHGDIIGGIWPWKVWRYLWQQAIRHRNAGEFENMFEKSINRRWVYTVFEEFLRVRFWRIYKKL